MAKKPPAKPLKKKDMKKTQGGRKAGGEQQEYLKIEIKDVIITG